MSKRYVVSAQVEKLEDTGGYLAICPGIPGCRAEGKTVAEALDNLQDVARVLLELQMEDGSGPPEGVREAEPSSVQLQAEVVVAVGERQTAQPEPVGVTQPSRSYAFRVIVEPDEDRWQAYCPALETLGAATWGYTHAEALKHIQEVVQMVVEELIEDGDPLPDGPDEEVRLFPEIRVLVTV